MAHVYALRLPKLIESKLNGNECRRLVEDMLASFSEWIARNETIFFREYTDHGPSHIEGVLETACTLMTPESASIVSAEDACLFVCSTVIHDCALHLQESGFLHLVRNANMLIEPELDHDVWPVLWNRFLSEAGRMNQRQLNELFGVREPIPPPDLDHPGSWTSLQFALIGEFLRRHHHRIAYEISVHGVPGANGESPMEKIAADDPLRPFLHLSGLIARSHGTTLRGLFDYLKKHYHLRKYNGAHPIYLMALLRIADYLQMQSSRAPGGVARVKRLRSPISRREWDVHGAVSDIIYDEHEDPETVEVSVDPSKTPIDVFLRIREWLDGVQQELDTSWAVLGEVYGRFPERALGLLIRRVRSNIDNVSSFGLRAGYVPKRVTFSAADAELLKLLIKPLYGDRPEIAVRELVQNAVDAIREQAALDGYTVPRDEGVTVSVKNNANGTWSLIVDDTGIGMTFDTLQNFFLNAGASFRTSMVWKQKFQDDHGKATVLRSGRFGVGALAAFLVADDPTHVKLRVATRHCLAGEEHGFSFEASLTDRPIEIRHERRTKPGTRVEVITQSPPAFMQEAGDNDKISSRWDWYCLDWPPVRRISADGRELRQEVLLPGSIGTIPGDHHWIEPAGYAGVCWTYNAAAPAIVCNGLIVMRSQGATRMSPQLEQVESPLGTIRVSMPALSVFDRDGRLPLTLDRLRVDYERITFLDDLRSDVLRNIVAFLVVCAPEDILDAKAFDPTVHKELHTHPAISDTIKMLSWLVMADGVTIFDPGLAIQTGIGNLVEFQSSKDARKFMRGCRREGVGLAIVPESMFERVSEGKLSGFPDGRYGSFKSQSELRQTDLDTLRRALDFMRGDSHVWEDPVRRTRDMDPREFIDRLEQTLRRLDDGLRRAPDGDEAVEWLREILDQIRYEVDRQGIVTERAYTVLDLLLSVSRQPRRSDMDIVRRALEVARGGYADEWDAPIRRSKEMDPREFEDLLSNKLGRIDRTLNELRDGTKHRKLLHEIWDRAREDLRLKGRVTRRTKSVLDLLSTVGEQPHQSDVVVVNRALEVLRGDYDEVRGAPLRSKRRMSYREFESELGETLQRIEDSIRETTHGHEVVGWLREIWDRARHDVDPSGRVTDRVESVLDLLSSIRTHKQRRFNRKEHNELANPVLDWDSLEKEPIENSEWFVAEYSCRAGKSGKASDGFFARVWMTHVGCPFIPHSLSDRKRKLAHLWDNPDFIRHMKHWESVRNRTMKETG